MRRPQRQLNRLNALKVASLIKRRGHACDGGGLWLIATSDSAASYVFRYTQGGKARSMGLGSARAIDLAEARRRATEARALLDMGQDPLELRKAPLAMPKAPARLSMTFKECAERYVESHRAGWRNEKHAAQWTSTLSSYAYPTIGAVDVAAVDTGLVCAILEPIWTVKPETASRIRGRIESVLNWATARGYRSGENPARWRGHLSNLLAATSRIHRTRHHPAMPYVEVPAFVQQLRQSDTQGARALEFLILTAARTGEVIGAQWAEIDMTFGVWTVPGERMKAGRLHRVPLVERAVELLEVQLKLTNGIGAVFQSSTQHRQLSNMALLAVLERTGKGDFTTHGFRSSFRNWVAEQTAYPREIAEMALAHVNGDRVESAYLRTDHFEKRWRLMVEWSTYLSAVPITSDIVVPMRRASEG